MIYVYLFLYYVHLSIYTYYILFINHFKRQKYSHFTIKSAKLFYSLPSCAVQEVTLILAVSHLSLWTLSNPFHLFSDLLLLLILSITVKCLRRLPWWILWSACSQCAWSMFSVPYEYRSKWSGLVAGSWGNQDTADHSPVFTGLQTLSLAGADVGSYVLPNKSTYQHSQMENCSPDWEARGLGFCSPHFSSEIQWGHWNFIGTHSRSSA